MTFDDLWGIIYNRNGALRRGKATITTENFRKAIRLAYDEGRKAEAKANPFSAFFGKAQPGN